MVGVITNSFVHFRAIVNIYQNDWILYDGQKTDYEYIDISSSDETICKEIQGKYDVIIAVLYRKM